MLKNKIVELRRANNDTQECLAKKLSVSRSLIAKWEQGRAIPNNEYMKKIYEIYNVSYERMIELDEILSHKEKDNKLYIISVIIGEFVLLTLTSILCVIFDKILKINLISFYYVLFPFIVLAFNCILVRNGKKYAKNIDFNDKILIPIVITIFCCFFHFIIDVCIEWIFYGINSLKEDMPWKTLFILLELVILGVLNIGSFNLVKLIKK